MASYSHLIPRIINTPLAITAEKLSILTEEVAIKLLLSEAIDRSVPSTNGFSSEEKELIPIIHVKGSTVAKSGAGSSGIVSYECIQRSIKAQVESGITSILLHIHSEGGETAGLFPLTDYINSLAKQGVTIYGFTDTYALSAGYALLASCEKVFATRVAEVGSIGVIASLVDLTKKNELEGRSYTIIRSKPDKAIISSVEPTSNKMLEVIQQKVDQMDSEFDSNMASYRGKKLTKETIVSLKGKSVPAFEAVELGLVDKIVLGIDEVLTIINSENNQGSVQSDNINYTSLYNEESKMVDVNSNDVAAKLVALQSELTTLQGSQNLATTKAVEEERQRVVKIMEAGNTFAVSKDLVISCIQDGYTLDMVSKMFSTLKASADAASSIITAGQPQGSADASMQQQLIKDEVENLMGKDPKNISLASFEGSILAGLKAKEVSQNLFSKMGGF